MAHRPIVALAYGFAALAQAKAARLPVAAYFGLAVALMPMSLVVWRPLAVLVGPSFALGIACILAATAIACIFLYHVTEQKRQHLQRASAHLAAESKRPMTAHEELEFASRISASRELTSQAPAINPLDVLSRTRVVRTALSKRDNLPRPLVLGGMIATTLAGVSLDRPGELASLAFLLACSIVGLCAGRMVYVHQRIRAIQDFLATTEGFLEEAGDSMSNAILCAIAEEVDYWDMAERPINGWPSPEGGRR